MFRLLSLSIDVNMTVGEFTRDICLSSRNHSPPT